MLATQAFATPTAGVLFDNSRSTRPAEVRLANVTSSPGDVRLSGTPTGLTASSGYAWQPTHGLSLSLSVNPYGVLAGCANGTQTLSVLADQ